MECLRIKFILPNHYPLVFEKDRNVCLELPEQALDFLVNILKEDNYTSYTFKSHPIKTKLSDETIAKIENALFLSFVDFDIGLLLNPNIASGVITEHGKKYFGEHVNSDFIGIKIIDCNARHLTATASIKGNIPGNDLISAVNNHLKNNRIIDNKFKRAIELYNSTNYLTQINNSGKFVLLMSAIECLIDPKDNLKEVASIIANTQNEIKKLNVPKDVKDSVVGSLNFLKKESIKRSGKILINDLFNGCTETFNSLPPTEFFSKAYDVRSKLVHEGKTEIKNLNIENAQMQDFTSITLKKYFDKNYR